MAKTPEELPHLILLDIIDRNGDLILGFIWTMILRFQIQNTLGTVTLKIMLLFLLLNRVIDVQTVDTKKVCNLRIYLKITFFHLVI